MRQNVERSCATCDAFLLNKDLQVKLGMARQGWCRAEPPKLVQSMVQQMGPRGMEVLPGFQGMFVPTASDCWCRQWKAAGAIIEEIPNAAAADSNPAA
jgi:hypothetical protein